MTTDIATLHPTLSTIRRAEWQLCRDAIDGEGAIKARAYEYLPQPSGFAAQEDGGQSMYQAYRSRATFPELMAPSVSAMIGIIHGREIRIDMPDSMAYLYEDSDGNGLPLEAFHRRVTRELLIIGSYAILADVPREGGDPYLSGYSRDRLINWDKDWWVLDETRMIRKGFVWDQLRQYLLLHIDGGLYSPMMYDENGNFEEIEVLGVGGTPLPRIPFVVGSAVDLSPRIEAPPLIGVARAALAMYQLSADYRHQLYMSGQETLVAIDGEAPDAVGAGVVHQMFSGGEGKQARLEYVSPTCSGIDAHEKAMDRERVAAIMAGARLFEDRSAQESGEAKRLRYASETATLISVAQNSCAMLEKSLRNIGMIMGMTEQQQAEIVVHAPTDLMDRTMSPREFAALFGIYSQGGMSWETYFANGQRGGIFSVEDTAEDEAKRLDAPLAGNNGDMV